MELGAQLTSSLLPSANSSCLIALILQTPRGLVSLATLSLALASGPMDSAHPLAPVPWAIQSFIPSILSP